MQSSLNDQTAQLEQQQAEVIQLFERIKDMSQEREQLMIQLEQLKGQSHRSAHFNTDDTRDVFDSREN